MVCRADEDGYMRCEPIAMADKIKAVEFLLQGRTTDYDDRQVEAVAERLRAVLDDRQGVITRVVDVVCTEPPKNFVSVGALFRSENQGKKKAEGEEKMAAEKALFEWGTCLEEEFHDNAEAIPEDWDLLQRNMFG